MRIVGLASQLANGKDTVANFLVAKFNKVATQGVWKRVAFANAVKQIYMSAFDKTFEFIEEWKRRPEPPEGMDQTVRQSLQFIGDGFRKIQGDVWIQTLLRQVGPKDNVVISDGRYINEGRQVKNKGGYNVLLWRPGFENDDPNPSESQIKPLVMYCAKHFDNGTHGGPLNLSQCPANDPPPPGLEYYDYFFINRGTLEEVEHEIDINLRMHVTNYFRCPFDADYAGLMKPHRYDVVKKGWGHEKWLWNNGYCGKILTFEKDKRCSWHYHDLKDETFYLLSGKLRLLYGWSDKLEEAEEVILEPGQVFHLPRKLRHQMIAWENSQLIEFSTQHMEEDSIRLQKGD